MELCKECLDSEWVSSAGKFVDKFEDLVAKYVGCKFAIACTNGTSALHLALKIMNVEKNCEVLLPSLNFVASANAVKYCGATPHFVDSYKKTLGIKYLSIYLLLGNASFPTKVIASDYPILFITFLIPAENYLSRLRLF